MILKRLCPPALIYLIFSVTQIGIDVVKGYFNTALMKVWQCVIFTVLLQFLCNSGLGIISWIIVFVPFMLMTIITLMLLTVFGLDPKNGKLKVYDNQPPLISNEKKNHNHSHDHIEQPQDKQVVGDPPRTTDDLQTNETEAEEIKEDELNYDKAMIQNDGKGKDYKFNWFSRLYSGENKFGKRREYVKIVRNVLIDMGKMDIAASFANQAETCINRTTDTEFESCLKILCIDVGEQLGGESKNTFLNKLKSRNII
jgi:hypothetical protein|uniref:Uncharacterized protein n=1 Tax=viral metagenome TaxID=1070528 RepID=A0A6C0AL26_9ZZZZ